MGILSRSKQNTGRRSQNKNQSKSSFEIKGIIIIGIGILTLFGIYTNYAGFLSRILQKITFLIFGLLCFAVPVYILLIGYKYLKGKGNIALTRRFYGINIFLIIIALIFSTIFIQSMATPPVYSDNISKIISESLNGNVILQGGIIAYSVAHLLYILIGSIGSYILYGTMLAIAVIETFNISILDMLVQAKQNSVKKRKQKKESKLDNDESTSKFINVSSGDDKTKKKNDTLEDVNQKIKILDFMKNSTLEDYQNEFAPPEVQNYQEKDNTQKKDNKLNDKLKDEVSSELDSKVKESSGEIANYLYPDIELLNNNGKTKLNSSDKKELIENASKLEEILSNFNVDAKVVQVTKGPTVTRFELQPSPGVKVSKIVNLSDDIALGLAASGVRIEAPIPGKAAVGIEVPNKNQTSVFLREVIDSEEFKSSKSKLAFALGKDIGGTCVVGDLSKMPHTLIAGATGSGKSVCINSLIISLLYKYKPDEVRLLLVDPKVVELNIYNGIPHLLIPVVTDPKKAAAALNWAVNEMTKRYNMFAEAGVRNIDSYNALFDKGEIEQKLPYIVIVVDELADLMMACPNDVEDYICRLAQMARAAGMHLVIATQRPSVNVITGVIKANIPSRISFAVSSQVDSRTILDSAGAEKLLGKGDMLYYPVGASKPHRVQGCFISEEEVESVVEFIKKDEETVNYEEDIIEHINKESEETGEVTNDDDADELLPDVIKTVVEYDQASTSFIQRRFRIGFNRASRIMEQLEDRGIISERDGSKPRQVLLKKDDLD